MAEIDLLKRVINDSSELTKRGENQAALRLLDDAIEEAVRDNRSLWVCTLSRHASAIASEMGDLRLVRRYREQCLIRDPDNPLALFSVADILRRQGEEDLARRYAAKAYRFSVNSQTELDRALIESLLKAWPDVQE
jgi:tetratricopeptide (TPR) repeat protein